MIAKKDFGAIAGEQKSADGQVVWSKELPKTCTYSRFVTENSKPLNIFMIA